MGTRSYIALQIEEDEYLTIFCHYNGYPDDNGAILAEHYDKQEKVESLIQLGDLYFLRSKLEPNPDLPHNHSTPQPNVTIAYNRDEGWSDCEAVHKTLDELTVVVHGHPTASAVSCGGASIDWITARNTVLTPSRFKKTTSTPPLCEP